MTIEITRERPDSPDVAALIAELEDHLVSRYPAESRHGFSVDRLVAEGVDFFVARSAGRAVGCGGILFVDDPGRPYGEVKRMYVRPDARGQGCGRLVLERLEAHARGRGIDLLRLETGIDQAEAIALYEGSGFVRCPPFGPYRDDPLSPCYEKALG